MSDSNFFHPSLTNISYSCVSLAVFRGEPDKNNIIISWKFHGSIVVILNRIPIENLGETLLPNIFPVFRPLITKKTTTKIQKQKKKKWRMKIDTRFWRKSYSDGGEGRGKSSTRRTVKPTRSSLRPETKTLTGKRPGVPPDQSGTVLGRIDPGRCVTSEN